MKENQDNTLYGLKKLRPLGANPNCMYFIFDKEVSVSTRQAYADRINDMIYLAGKEENPELEKQVWVELFNPNSLFCKPLVGISPPLKQEALLPNDTGGSNVIKFEFFKTTPFDRRWYENPVEVENSNGTEARFVLEHQPGCKLIKLLLENGCDYNDVLKKALEEQNNDTALYTRPVL